MLLSAGALDPSYSSVYDGRRMSVAFSPQIHPQLDGKMLHCAYIGPINASMGMLLSLGIAFSVTPWLARLWMKPAAGRSALLKASFPTAST